MEGFEKFVDVSLGTISWAFLPIILFTGILLPGLCGGPADPHRRAELRPARVAGAGATRRERRRGLHLSQLGRNTQVLEAVARRAGCARLARESCFSTARNSYRLTTDTIDELRPTSLIGVRHKSKASLGREVRLLTAAMRARGGAARTRHPPEPMLALLHARAVALPSAAVRRRARVIHSACLPPEIAARSAPAERPRRAQRTNTDNHVVQQGGLHARGHAFTDHAWTVPPERRAGRQSARRRQDHQAGAVPQHGRHLRQAVFAPKQAKLPTPSPHTSPESFVDAAAPTPAKMDLMPGLGRSERRARFVKISLGFLDGGAACHYERVVKDV